MSTTAPAPSSSRKRKYMPDTQLRRPLPPLPRVEDQREVRRILIQLVERVEALTQQVDHLKTIRNNEYKLALRSKVTTSPDVADPNDPTAIPSTIETETVPRAGIFDPSPWCLSDSALIQIVDQIIASTGEPLTNIQTSPVLEKLIRKVLTHVVHYEKFVHKERLRHFFYLISRHPANHFTITNSTLAEFLKTFKQLVNNHRYRIRAGISKFICDYLGIEMPIITRRRARVKWQPTRPIMELVSELLAPSDNTSVKNEGDKPSDRAGSGDGPGTPGGPGSVWRDRLLPAVYLGQATTLNDEAFAFAQVKCWLEGELRNSETTCQKYMLEYVNITGGVIEQL
ncbi:hypothetical protein H4R33_002817 [Dimargaris cristalligena]|uniref:Uncharacterized protein n=1 Tax=Dimargaris cristalligena TaxID=215637 RepID=A0A4V1J4Z4_9FUNG|nr:hypothetical protein H4R33_002817 [Dimargaris cristalligena]RKP37269.1 hypothetical protein BJ085DRAFT_37123 [Dimargaris cristalligena]|eukprot:RKP37269.1 hypothetical protein BJ085DRAFT_37123 [Dimargaris cristalligena]